MNVIGRSIGVAQHSETSELLVVLVSSRTGFMFATPHESSSRWRNDYAGADERAFDERDGYLESFQVGVYRHYRGQHYQVIGLALDEADGTLYVVYVALEGAHLPGPRLRVRPAQMFFESVSVGDGLDRCESRELRFQYVGDAIRP